MPVEEETTAVTVSAIMPDTDSPIKQPTNADDTEKSLMAEPVEKNTETTENEVTHEDEKKSGEVEQEESKSKEDENKENVQENGSTVKEDGTDAVETKSKPEADKQTEGIVLRKRRTPEKKEGKEEGVSPPKKAVK